MNNTYGTVVTDAGAAAIAGCILAGTKLCVTQAAVGDGGGAYYPVDAGQTALRNELWRGAIAGAEQNPTADNVIDVKVVLGEDVGGFTVREAGLFDAAGTLIAVCSLPETEKTTGLGSISGRLTLLLHIAVVDAGAVAFTLNTSLDMVSREELDSILETLLPKKEDKITATGLLKRTADGTVVAAEAGVDFGLPAPAAEPGTALEDLKGTPGQHYYDSASGEEYLCTGQDSEGKYTWKATGAASAGYAQVFEPEDWTDAATCSVLRIPAERHKMEPKQRACICAVYQRIGRTAQDYNETTAAAGRAAIVNAVKAALSANNTAAGTYPTAEDGHVQLTWEQVQYYILEGVLDSASAAAAKAGQKGFAWQDRDTAGAVTSHTLDEVLAAAYLPALGGVSTALDTLCTAETLQGLRLRRKASGAGNVSHYELEGEMAASTWGVIGSEASWDMDTKDLIVQAPEPFAGTLRVLG